MFMEPLNYFDVNVWQWEVAEPQIFAALSGMLAALC